jgi:acyl-CoA thioesterase FadM
MIRSGAWKRIRGEGWYSIVAGQTIKYRHSLTLGQSFVVESRVIGFHGRWSYVSHTFLVGAEVFAEAVVRVRFLKETGGTVSPEELERLIGPTPSSLRLPEWVEEWTRSAAG